MYMLKSCMCVWTDLSVYVCVFGCIYETFFLQRTCTLGDYVRMGRRMCACMLCIWTYTYLYVFLSSYFFVVGNNEMLSIFNRV